MSESNGHEMIHHRELLEPPFWGTGEMLVWEPEPLIAGIGDKVLKREHASGSTLNDPDSYQLFEDLSREILKRELLQPRGFYGFFPVIADDTDLIVLNPGDFHSESAALHFPRSGFSGYRSIADLFRPEGDLLALQVASLGSGLQRFIEDLSQRKDETGRGLVESIGRHLIKDIENRVTREIRRGLGIDDTGRRFSFGEQGLPGVTEQAVLLDLLGAEDRMGMTVSQDGQINPEFSTLGVFAHNAHDVHA